MIKLIFQTPLLFFLFFFSTNHAQNYYLSSSSVINGSGTLISPWNSFTKLNELLSSSNQVDTIFLKRGDVFRDQITITTTNHFVITSYGSGKNPIISGADSVLNWEQVSGTQYWKADFKKPMINFFVNNKEQILARYPDEGTSYLKVDSGTTKYILYDDALNSIPSDVLNQSHVCVHTAQWCWEKSPIASSTNNSITYLIPTHREPTENYGYFLYDHLSYLTSGKEWKYDSVSESIYYQPITGNPDTFLCEASVRSYGILFYPGISDVIIKNVDFEKQAESGIAILNSTNQNIRVDSCSFARQYNFGIDQKGKHVEVSNCYFREVDGIAVYLNGSSFKAEIHHNIFRNNGGFRNSGIGMEINLSSITGSFVDSCHIHHNDIDSAGYCGISMDGKWNIIERNIIKNAMLINNDGAALKSFGTESQFNIFRNNFISKSDGNIDGVPVGSPDSYFPTPAIYFDYSTNNCTILENTIYDHTKKGIFLNASSNNNTVVGNVVYGGNYLLDFNGAPNPGIIFYQNMTGMTVKKNILFAKDSLAFILRMVDNTGGYNHGLVDSNYYFQPFNENNIVFIPPSTSINFSNWQSISGYDANTKKSFLSSNFSLNYDTLLMNPSDYPLTINLGNREYYDLDSNKVCGNITLQPYTSVILIKTSTCYSNIGFKEKQIYHQLNIFPNPFSYSTIIKTNVVLINATLTVYHLNGHEVMQINNINGQSIHFYRDHLSKGLYLIRIQDENELIAIDKFMITD